MLTSAPGALVKESKIVILHRNLEVVQSMPQKSKKWHFQFKTFFSSAPYLSYLVKLHQGHFLPNTIHK